ncbi:glycolipid 2-alpha-mannosyltransferase [Xylariales sp. PMI_506]|nr:glycolipid 2-alpha-mannosyltransferase [Xylariales sp. PMI_506]
MLPRFLRPTRRVPLWLVLPVVAAFLLEVAVHLYQYHVPRPQRELDVPFFTSCQEPDVSGKRESAALVMLARNKDRAKVKKAIENIDRVFNQWFNYPIVFLNNEPWDKRFIAELNQTSRGLASFEVIPEETWTFPNWIDDEAAKQSIKEQGEQGLPHASEEGYHHMCRFYSGKFYQMEALKKYRWYWRIEPDIEYTCAITYDPFVQMANHNKVYGFTLALWEVGRTCPSLFREVADWKELHNIPTTDLWRALMSASWMPYPFRRFLNFLAHRDRYGDPWSLCHYWSNFEIADMDFFRSNAYQEFFNHLDKRGGFYFERWGDAAVHTLAIAMFVEPRKVHHFEDFGYQHGDLFQCPGNAPGRQLPDSAALGNASWAAETDGGIGCRCQCDGATKMNFPDYCVNKITQPNTLKRAWFSWLL